jgi:hypothetical protein
MAGVQVLVLIQAHIRDPLLLLLNQALLQTLTCKSARFERE